MVVQSDLGIGMMVVTGERCWLNAILIIGEMESRGRGELRLKVWVI